MWGSFYWVVPIVIISIFLVLFLENKRYRTPVLWSMLCIWGVALAYLLFIYRLPGSKDTGVSLDLFHVYIKATGTDWEANQAWRQILFNILLYTPLGCVLMSLVRKIKISIAVGITISIVTEALQGITGLGWTDIDDVFNNLIGLLLGITIYNLQKKVISMRN